MGFLGSLFGPAIAGGLLGALAMVGLVYTQTAPPADNPASKPILSYGDRS